MDQTDPLPTPDPDAPAPTTTATSLPDPDPTSDPTPTPTPTPAPAPKIDYAAQRKQERIDKLTAEKAALQRELELARAGQSADAVKMQEEINARAAKLAAEQAEKIASWNSFNASLNTAIADGQKEYGTEKFDASVQALRGLYDANDPDTHTRYINMLQAVLDTGAAPKLLATLGEDPNEAARIMGLSPTKMGVELGKLATKDAEQVSAVPKPITPIDGRGRNHVAISAEDPERADALDMRVWMERRNAHVTDVNKRAGRRVIP